MSLRCIVTVYVLTHQVPSLVKVSGSFVHFITSCIGVLMSKFMYFASNKSPGHRVAFWTLIYYRHPKGWPKRPARVLKGMWDASWGIVH